MARDPYPLQWPPTWKRTPAVARQNPKFVARFALDRDTVIRQLKKRGASSIVITSDLPTRKDGLPYADARCPDPGIAVWWVQAGHEQVIACDRWKDVTQNLRAIDMSLEALRGMDRWGATEMVDRAFAGFAALPFGTPEKKPWYVVFDIATNIRGAFPKDEVLSIVKTRYRNMIKMAHPDAGGTAERAAELNVAMADAEAELG